MVLQLFNVDPTSMPRVGNVEAIEGVMSYKHGLSAILAICLPAFLRRRWAWGLIPIIIGLGMAKTFVGPLAVLAALLWFTWKGMKFWLSRVVLLTGTLILLVGYAVFIDAPDTAWRSRIMEVAAVEFMKHPFTGSGLNHFQFLFGDEDIAKYTANYRQYHKYGHNDFLQAGFEMGFLAPLIVLGYLVNVYRRYTSEVDMEVMTLITIFIAASVGFTFHIGLSALIAITQMAMLEKKLRGAYATEVVRCAVPSISANNHGLGHKLSYVHYSAGEGVGYRGNDKRTGGVQ